LGAKDRDETESVLELELAVEFLLPLMSIILAFSDGAKAIVSGSSTKEIELAKGLVILPLSNARCPTPAAGGGLRLRVE